MSSILNKLWNKSQTLYLSYAQAASSAAIGALYFVNNSVNSGEFKSLLGTIPNIPWWVPVALAGIAFLTFVAHGRHPDA